RLMNPNVAIELGFALHAVGWKRCLMVLNEAYGTIDDLPFDVRHRRHPVTYRLAHGGSRADIEPPHKELVNPFVETLSPFVSAQATPAAAEPFPETPPKIGRGLFFGHGESLGFHRTEKQDFLMPFRSVAWLRLIPRSPLPRTLALDLLQ